MAQEHIKIDNSDMKKVKPLKGLGFSDIDALHITLAEKASVGYFITCDDDIVNIYKQHRSSIRVTVVSLTEFVGLEVK